MYQRINVLKLAKNVEYKEIRCGYSPIKVLKYGLLI